MDYRISFAPAMFGQKCVIRILDTANTPYHVWDLQLPEWMLNEVQKACKADSGMMLVCGPTGSGKTSTLYAVIRDIDVSERNVVTIEDPVEIQLDGVTQIPVNDVQGNTFGALLRSVLRQDPDAILVGEVRDPETAPHRAAGRDHGASGVFDRSLQGHDRDDFPVAGFGR